MNELVTIINDCENLIVINKSKFFAFAFKVASENEVKDKLSKLGKQFQDATHICYAYDFDSKQKCSDNGEPQGTAGKPILDCIQKKKLKNVLVAVVRYFGGIKLGAGGLVRAYSTSASEVLLKAGIKNLKLNTNFCFEIMPNEISKINVLKHIQSNISFGEKIIVEVVCENLLKCVSEIENALSRKIDIQNVNETYS